MWRAKQATDNYIIQCMCFACWITKATDTHPEYVLLIAFPRRQWLRECVSVLCYTYVTYLVSVFRLIMSRMPPPLSYFPDTVHLFP